jgi:8-oxo-dGTP pyrophosphatase MutT (NUDIX family)
MKHFGIYTVAIREDSLLCVFKTRGPYQGLWDLPGGTPEPGESPEQTLSRELLEETGGSEVTFGPWMEFSFQVTRDSKGRPIKFLHEGFFRFSDLEGVRKDLPPKHDVGALAWLDLSDTPREILSPLVLKALAQEQRVKKS